MVVLCWYYISAMKLMYYFQKLRTSYLVPCTSNHTDRHASIYTTYCSTSNHTARHASTYTTYCSTSNHTARHASIYTTKHIISYGSYKSSNATNGAP